MSISNNDFRLKNLAYDEDGQIIQVKTLNYSQPHLSGVDLTEELLLNFGATIIEGIGWKNYCFRDSDLQVDMNRNLAYVQRYDEDAVGFPCKYIHQLQNLYYALCGEELIQ